MRKIAIAAASALAVLAAVPVITTPAHAESATWLKIEGNWNQFAGKVKQQWGKLTDDDLTTIKGHRQELVGKIQERRSEEHTSELQSLMRISYAVFFLKKQKQTQLTNP